MKNKIAVIGLKGLPAFGGAATVGENIIEELKNKIDFTVLSVSSHASKKINKQSGYKQVVFNKVGNGGVNTLIYTVKCMFHCLFNNYDLIHLHHASSGFITPFLRLKYKVVVTFHGVHRYKDPKFSNLHNLFFRFSERLNVKCANEIISVSEPDLDFILKKYNKKIVYIPNGISSNASLKHNFKKNINGSYILFAAARIYEIKGLHLLLLAAKKSDINIEIKIAGDINQSESYKNEIKNLSKGLNVSFLGLIKDKAELLELVANAKLFIFPSLHEAMSMMLLEVASVKTPLITSDIAANKAIFNDTEVLYFASENVDDLATKINYALTNENELRARANNAFEKLERDYSWKIISEQYEKIFNRLMS